MLKNCRAQVQMSITRQVDFLFDDEANQSLDQQCLMCAQDQYDFEDAEVVGWNICLIGLQFI